MQVKKNLAPIGRYLTRPYRLFRDYDLANLRPDFIAGITVAVIALPQAIAFAIIAELPPQMGLFAVIIAGIAGSLWGSSDQMMTGPANAISLLVFSALSGIAVPNTEAYVIAAGMLAVLVGVFQLVMGLARLGVLVNFVSHSVIVGFASGAGVLILIKQIEPLLGLDFSAPSIVDTVVELVHHLSETDLRTASLGIGTMIFFLVLRAINPKIPAALFAMIASSVAFFLLGWIDTDVATIGEIPSQFPPIANLPIFNFELIGQLMTGAVAVGAIGLVEAAAIARSMSAQTGQRLESNQEFVGQGLSNIFAGIFSGFAGAGSFSRSAVNFGAGAKTAMSGVIASVFVLMAMFLFAPLAKYLPVTALAGVLIVTAYRMVDKAEMKRIWKGTRSGAAIMTLTFLGTLFLPLETAVLSGILLSFILYVRKTSTPHVHFLLPDPQFKHFVPMAGLDPCPQLSIMEIRGDIYFGAVSHIEEEVLDHTDKFPDERYLLVRMHAVNQLDASGVYVLENIVKLYRERGGDVFFVRTGKDVRQIMTQTKFFDYCGEANFLDEDEAIAHLFYRVLDPAVCIYECPFRAFKECQNLPKFEFPQELPVMGQIPVGQVGEMPALSLYHALQSKNGTKPILLDVREPREYRRGHIPQAELKPLSKLLLTQEKEMPQNKPIILVCRTGRRSRRAAYYFQQKGYDNIQILQGGILAWEDAGLLEAVDYSAP